MSEIFDMVDRLLQTSIENIAMGIFDSFMEENRNVRASAGMSGRTIRRQLARCCDWCAALEGVYPFGEEPDDIYRRHRGCRCTVVTDYGTGFQDVWTKREYKDLRETIINQQEYLQKRDQLKKKELWEAIREYDRKRYYETHSGTGKKVRMRQMYADAQKRKSEGRKASLVDVIMEK